MRSPRPLRSSGRFALAAAIAAASLANPVYTARADPKTTDVIGYVKTASADAQVWLQGRASKAEPGSALVAGNVLKTGPSGSVGATFKDSSIVSLGPNSEISVDEYLYEPIPSRFKFSATLLAGSLYYMAGEISKADPEAVAITTPQGTIHVRRARLLAKVDPASIAASAP